MPDRETLEKLLQEIAFDNANGAKLKIEDIAAFLPGLARLMPEVGARTWKLYYAAKAENWPLARFQLKEARKLLEMCTVTRPKYKKPIDHFIATDVKAMMDAIDASDWPAFDKAFAHAVEEANAYHETYNKGFLVWKVPDQPPPDLDLTPRPQK